MTNENDVERLKADAWHAWGGNGNSDHPEDVIKWTIDHLTASGRLAGWMPIESAPRDGTKFLSWDGSGVWICYFLDGVLKPNRPNVTHWQSIPPAPSARKEG